MEDYLRRNFAVEHKRPSEEALRRWRSAVALVKNRSRRFRMVADLAKRALADRSRKLLQMTLSRSVEHDILRREVEIVGGSFVVKLSFELDILRCEVEIQGLFHQIGFKLDIIRCEVEIQY
ncbi:hypothetical protein F3Y22_tig00110984pilonHSYRG00031 [Hibiscus syriacus]|uniref:Calcium-transporting P-type ATPase N-terminal autoinhibitory domain-containing protein n=1 Tax=Hibiscus syriacus TaxID=106335 RepID=A0A6A2Z9A7_HIBSY|nr:hypothetical protein F3Y22_tig00110984pilonHSYRG00031 [Hibiscus syriacus]